MARANAASHGDREKSVNADWAAATASRRAELRRVAQQYLADADDGLVPLPRRLDDSKKKADEFELSVRALSKALHPLVGSQLPQMSHLLSTLVVEGFDKTALKVAGATTAIALGAKAIEDYIAVNKEFIAQMQAMPQWATASTNALKMLTDALNDAGRAAHQTELQLEAIRNKPITPSEGTQRSQERRDIVNAATNTIEDRKKAVELAGVDASSMTEAQKTEARYQIEQRYVAEKKAREDTEARKRIASLYSSLGGEQANEESYRGQVASQNEAYQNAKLAADKNKKRSEEFQQTIDAATKARDEINKDLEANFSLKDLDQIRKNQGSFAGWLTMHGELGSGFAGTGATRFSEYQLAYQKLLQKDQQEALIAQSKASLQKSEARQPGLDQAQDTAKSKLDEFNARLTETVQKIQELTKAFENAKLKLETDAKQRAGEQRLNALEGSYKELEALQSQWKSLGGKAQLTPEELLQMQVLRGLIPQVQARIQGLESQPMPNGDLYPATPPTTSRNQSSSTAQPIAAAAEIRSAQTETAQVFTGLIGEILLGQRQMLETMKSQGQQIRDLSSRINQSRSIS
jgi:hypothetical protein